MRSERRSASSTTKPTSASTPRFFVFSSTAFAFSRMYLRSSIVPPYCRQVSGFSKGLSAAVILSCQISQGPVLCSDAHVEQGGVQQREDDRRYPGAEDEREGQDLHGDDDVVGMREVAVWSPPDERSARHDEYPRIPVLSQGEDRPVPQ